MLTQLLLFPFHLTSVLGDLLSQSVRLALELFNDSKKLLLMVCGVGLSILGPGLFALILA